MFKFIFAFVRVIEYLHQEKILVMRQTRTNRVCPRHLKTQVHKIKGKTHVIGLMPHHSGSLNNKGC